MPISTSLHCSDQLLVFSSTWLYLSCLVPTSQSERLQSHLSLPLQFHYFPEWPTPVFLCKSLASSWKSRAIHGHHVHILASLWKEVWAHLFPPRWNCSLQCGRWVTSLSHPAGSLWHPLPFLYLSHSWLPAESLRFFSFGFQDAGLSHRAILS